MATSGTGRDAHGDDCKDGGTHCLSGMGLERDSPAPKFQSETLVTKPLGPKRGNSAASLSRGVQVNGVAEKSQWAAPAIQVGNGLGPASSTAPKVLMGYSHLIPASHPGPL